MNHRLRTGIFPGTFDPPTMGHIDLIRRGARLFDCLIVAIASNTAKTPMFTEDERKTMLEETVGDLKNVRVEVFNGLIVDFAQENKARAIMRGIRSYTDYENEFQMAYTNRRLAEDIEIIFIVPSVETSFISSRLVKEAAMVGGDISPLVPESVAKKVRSRLGKSGRIDR